MANVALGKAVEEPMMNADAATDGKISGYTGTTGFAKFSWPGTLTIDLSDEHSLYCVRILLWDNLGTPSGTRANRFYKYRLLLSTDHLSWKVIYDSGKDGFVGWQVFTFTKGIKARYIRVHGLWNSANARMHIVQVEAHDSPAPELNSEAVIQRTVTPDSVQEELGDGLPLTSRVRIIINDIEKLIESNPYLKPEPFHALLSQLRMQVNDVAAIERSMDSVRREIIGPVKEELDRSSKLGRFSVWGFYLGMIGGILGIISIVLAIISML